MKTVKDLFAMQNVMTDAVLNKTNFVYDGVNFSREEWIEWCEEQEGVRFCQECGELMTDGYLVGGSDTYCSLDCVKDANALTDDEFKEFNNAVENDLEWDDDNFFYTEWEEEL